MATRIDLAEDHCTDIDVVFADVSISVEVGNCNNADIDVDIFDGGAGVSVMNAREITYASVVVNSTGTYTASADFSGMQDRPKYLVFIYSDAGPRAGGVTMSYYDGSTTITPTITGLATEAWFGAADGFATIGYYIGNDIPLTGTIRCIASSTLTGGSGRMTVVAGTAFGNVSYEGHAEYESFAGFGNIADTTVFGNGSEKAIIPFGAHGGQAAYDVNSSNIYMVGSLVNSVYQSSTGTTSYSWPLFPDSLDFNSPLAVEYFSCKGALAILALSDDADSTTDLTLYPEPNRVEFSVVVERASDTITVTVERGSC